MDLIASDVSRIRQDLDGFKTRISEVENRVSTLKDSTKSDSKEIRALQLRVRRLQEKAIDTENHPRGNNIRILGLPERAEGTISTEFTEQLLTSVLDLGNVPSTFVVERAHMVPPIPPKLGAPLGLFYYDY